MPGAVFTFPPIEAVLATWLGPQLAPVVGGTATVLSETPNNLNQMLPAIKVQRAGGRTEWWTDCPTVDIECYQPTAEQAATLAEQVRFALAYQIRGVPISVAWGNRLAATVAVSEVDVMAGISYRPYDDYTVKRFGATYMMRLHPLSSVPS